MICLLPHCGYLSETTRMLAIYKALVKCGTRVVVATHGGAYERLLAEAGVQYHIVGPHMSEARAQQLIRIGPGMGPSNQSMWSDEEILQYVLAESEFFSTHGVRGAVTGFTLTTLLSTRIAGIKLVTEHAGSFVPPIWERKLIEPYLTPPLPFVRRLPHGPQHWIANLGINLTKAYCGGFNRVAKQLGIKGVPSFAAMMLGDLSLVPEAPEVLGIPKTELETWRPGRRGYRASTRLRYTGPLFAELDRPLSRRVLRFLEGPRPIVYVAIASTAADQVRAVVQALRSADVRILVAGTVHALADLESENVIVEGVLASQHVMPRVDLAITAGGQGSVQCAMAAGTPLITIPLQPEQDWNGQLIERCGAGQRISIIDAATPTLATLARSILSQPCYRENAIRIQAIYARLDGPALAAQAILDFVKADPDEVI